VGDAVPRVPAPLHPWHDDAHCRVMYILLEERERESVLTDLLVSVRGGLGPAPPDSDDASKTAVLLLRPGGAAAWW